MERDPELARLAGWLAAGGLAGARIEPLAGDVSARRYARIRPPAGGSLLAVLHPPELAEVRQRFVAAAALLAKAGVRVPAILRDDAAAAILLVEDLGERTLCERTDLDWAARQPYFEAAIDAARRIAAIPLAEVERLGSPPLDAELLERELDGTIEVFLDPRGLAPAPFVAGLREVCRRLGAGPLVACHRDFMARNLMPLEGGRVAVIDFQDLRPGPAAYDLASLLNDSLFVPEPLESEWLARALPPDADPLDYSRAVVQRTLKAVGTFTRFAAAGNPRHLPLIPPSLERAARHLARLPEVADAFAPLAGRFAALSGGEPVC